MHLRREWVEAQADEQAMLGKRIQPVPPPRLPAPAAIEPVKAAGYNDIAQKMLFSKDRNPWWWWNRRPRRKRFQCRRFRYSTGW